MAHPKKKDRLPFKALSKDITVTSTKDRALLQVKPAKPGASAVIEFCYDGTAGGNKRENALHNARTHAVQAGPEQPAQDANHVWFRVNHPCVTDAFCEEAIEIVSKNIIPAMIKAVTGFDFLDKPKELLFHPDAKSEKYVGFIKAAAEKSGFEIKPVAVQVGGGTRKVDGFALVL